MELPEPIEKPEPTFDKPKPQEVEPVELEPVEDEVLDIEDLWMPGPVII